MTQSNSFHPSLWVRLKPLILLAALFWPLSKLSWPLIKAGSRGEPPWQQAEEEGCLTGSRVPQPCWWHISGWASCWQQHQHPAHLYTHTFPYCQLFLVWLFIPYLHMCISFMLPWSTPLLLSSWKFILIIFVHVPSSLRSWGANACWKPSLKLLLTHRVALLACGSQLFVCHMAVETFFSLNISLQQGWLPFFLCLWTP